MVGALKGVRLGNLFEFVDNCFKDHWTLQLEMGFEVQNRCGNHAKMFMERFGDAGALIFKPWVACLMNG